MLALLAKRSRIFLRRWVLAIVMLVFPVVLEIVASTFLPSSSDFLASLLETGSVKPLNINMNMYGRQNIPLSYTDNISQDERSLLKSYLELSSQKNVSKTSINFMDVDVGNETLNDFVLKERERELKLIYSDYYGGIAMSKNPSNQLLSFVLYHSSLVYHSSVNILHLVNNMMLTLATNDTKKSIKTINAPVKAVLNSNFDPRDLDIFGCLESIPFSLLDFINSIIIALIISLSTIHLTRERKNGSKALQLLSGTHFTTYWIANYIFEYLVYFFNIVLMVVAIKVVSMVMKSETTSEAVMIGSDAESLGYLFLFLAISCLSWAALSSFWSFLFKSDIVGFVVLLIVLSVAAFLDMVSVILKLFGSIGPNETKVLGQVADILRIVFTILFPNVAAKRAIYNLKIRNNEVCIITLNEGLNGKEFEHSSFAE